MQGLLLKRGKHLPMWVGHTPQKEGPLKIAKKNKSAILGLANTFSTAMFKKVIF